MFKRLQIWFFRPVLEELWGFHHQMQVMRLMAFARHQELENIIDNLTGDNENLQEQITHSASFGKAMDEADLA